MLLRFTGTYTGGRTSITLCGVTFEGREPSLVTGEEALRRLSNHPEFERVTKYALPKETREEWLDRFNAEFEATAQPEFQTAPKPRGRPKGKR